MTEEKTLKGNKLIAEFMGEKVVGSCGEWVDIEFQGKPMTAHYHSSWDWLMPVVKKCCDDLRAMGFDSRGSYKPELGYVSDIYLMRLDNPIEKVFDAVVNHIKRFKK